LNIKEDNHPLLAAVLAGLESDNDWNVETAIGKVYVAQGVKRYKLEGLTQFQKVATVESEKESLAVKGVGLCKGPVPSASSASSSGGAVAIKQENPLMGEFLQSLVVVKSAKGAFKLNAPTHCNQQLDYKRKHTNKPRDQAPWKSSTLGRWT